MKTKLFIKTNNTFIHCWIIFIYFSIHFKKFVKSTSNEKLVLFPTFIVYVIKLLF